MDQWLIVALVSGGFIGSDPLAFDHRKRYPTEQICETSKPGIQANAEPQIRLVMEEIQRQLPPSPGAFRIVFECQKAVSQ